MPPVRGRAAHVVDRARRGRDEATELHQLRVARREATLPAVRVEYRRGERFGMWRAEDRRTTRAEADADTPPGAVDDEREASDGDDHRVAGADLHERLRRTGVVPFRADDDLVRAADVLLRPGHELGEREAALAPLRAENDDRVERREHRQRVARGRARGDVAAQRSGVADLRGPNGP